MVEIPRWTGEVRSFAYSYDAEQDDVIVIPLDGEGDPIDDGICLAMDASVMGTLLGLLSEGFKGIMDVRRSVRRGISRGVVPEVIQGRYQAIVIAEDIDSCLRRQSRVAQDS